MESQDLCCQGNRTVYILDSTGLSRTLLYLTGLRRECVSPYMRLPKPEPIWAQMFWYQVRCHGSDSLMRGNSD